MCFMHYYLKQLIFHFNVFFCRYLLIQVDYCNKRYIRHIGVSIDGSCYCIWTRIRIRYVICMSLIILLSTF